MRKTDVDNYLDDLKRRLNWGGKHFPKTNEERLADQHFLKDYALKTNTEEQKRISLFTNAAYQLNTYADSKIRDEIVKNHDLADEHLFEKFSNKNIKNKEQQQMAQVKSESSDEVIKDKPAFNTKTSDAMTKLANSSNSTINSNETSNSSISLNNQRSTTDMINMLLHPQKQNNNVASPNNSINTAPQFDNRQKKDLVGKPKLIDKTVLEAQKQAEAKKKAQEEQKRKDEELRQKQLAEQARIKRAEKEARAKAETEKEAKEPHYRVFDNHKQATTLTESKIIRLAQQYDKNITTIYGAIKELESHGLMVW